MNKRTYDRIKGYFAVAAGAAIAAFSLVVILEPGHMAPGGLASVAALVSEVVPLKIGTLLFIINIPLLGLAFYEDKHFLVKTLIGTIFYSFFANVWSYVPVPELDNILRSIFGGAMIGFGLGIIFMVGGSSGGSDIIAWFISRRKTGIRIGKSILIVDLIIIAVQGLIYKSLQSALFATLALIISTRVIDFVIEGSSTLTKTVYIISDEYRKISESIFDKVDRGVTALSAQGMYTGQNKKVLFCSIAVKELPAIKKIISDIDSGAFVIVTDTREVLGNGFNNIVV